MKLKLFFFQSETLEIELENIVITLTSKKTSKCNKSGC